MKVVLKADVKGTGKKDELVNVSDGYARNYLFPRNLAIPADKAALTDLKNKNDAIRFRQETELKNANELRKKLDGKVVVIEAKGGSAGRLFGSVTAKEIAETISRLYEVDVDKRKVQIDSDIKTFGIYDAVIKLHQGVNANIRVKVQEKEN